MLLPAALLETLPRGCAIVPTVDGLQVLRPPTLAVGLRDRQTPLAPAAAVLRPIFAEHGVALPALRHQVTPEGQPAVIGEVALEGRTLAAGIVFADSWYRVLTGRGTADDGPVVSRLVSGLVDLPLGLAHRRRRWFEYQPPPGWGGVVRHGLITEWLAPGFPRDRAMITVFPARPTAASTTDAWDREVHELSWSGHSTEVVGAPTLLSLGPGLEGRSFGIVGRWGDGPRTFTELALVVDGTFTYVLRLDEHARPPTPHAATFHALLRSMTRVPAR